MAQPNTRLYVAEQLGELIALTIISFTSQCEAEFRIALRADKAGQGLGRIITAATLAIGFDEIGLQRIHLIVRKSNLRAVRLYQQQNFSVCGECQITVNHLLTDFLRMKLFRKDYIASYWGMGLQKL